MDDIVTITCYNETETRTRKDALNFYLECMMMSEGAEKERYTNIYLALLSGRTIIKDI